MKISNLIAFTPTPVSEAPSVAPRLTPRQALAIARVLDMVGVLDVHDYLFQEDDLIEAYFEGEAIIEGMARS